MGKHHEYIKGSLWFKEKIDDPYQVIAAFFDFANVNMHRDDMSELLEAAVSKKVWKGCSMNDLEARFEKLESLVNAAYLINMENKQQGLEIRKDDISNPNLYFGLNDNLTVWDYFPRTLSFEEFIDPYKAIRCFFKYQDLLEWKETMNGLMQFGVTKNSLSENDVFFDTYAVYTNFVKLIEAAHLIDVREVNHIGGRIKYMFKKKTVF
jgi:hypothetical protein